MTTNSNMRDRLVEVLTRELGDTYDCTRVWEAWDYKNMDKNDFDPVLWRVDDIVQSLLNAIEA